MSVHVSIWRAALLLVLVFALGVTVTTAQDDAPPPAKIVNDEGGAVVITGEVTYTNPFFTSGVAQPVIITEDQAGFVDRNRYFLMSPESQTLGQITSDFYESPFSYSLTLPIEPQGEYRDVDQDEEEEQGVQVFAIAYWTNTFGDPFLEERDLYGGGWSTAYASTRVSENPSSENEIVGGKFLIYSPDDQQGFPSGFGEDGLLFTEDDPIVIVPQGYTIVDMDTDPFTFDRSKEPVIDLIEPETTALDDFSAMSYTEAFDAMVEKFRTEYAFTEHKNLDWDALSEEYRPRFEAAEENGDVLEYRRALRDFLWEIPDGHVSGPFVQEDFQTAISGGIGLAIRDVDDGRVIVTFLTPGGPAEEAGIELTAEIIAINGTPIDEWVDNTIAQSAPFSTEHFERLQKLRYAVRFPFGESVEVTYRNPGDSEDQTVTLQTSDEGQSFSVTSFNVGLTGFELPVEYRLLDSGLGYVKIYSFSDNDLLSIQLWERMIQTLNAAGVPGLIIDMRQNGGGSGFLADQMAAYFFDEPLELGSTGFWDEELGEFYFDPRGVDRFYPPAEDLRYHGEVAVLVGPSCASACEFFTYDMTLQDRAAIVGMYPTAGLGGSVEDFLMPEGEFVRFTIGRAVNAEGEIHIEGQGVAPTVQVPVTEQTLLGGGDPILDAAVEYLYEQLGVAPSGEVTVIDGGEIAVDESVDGTVEPGQRVRYTLVSPEDVSVNIGVSDETGDLDTYLRVYSADDELLVENDDIELGVVISSALRSFPLVAGETYFIEVGTYGDASGGDYTLHVERVVDQEGAQPLPLPEATDDEPEPTAEVTTEPTTAPDPEPTEDVSEPEPEPTPEATSES